LGNLLKPAESYNSGVTLQDNADNKLLGFQGGSFAQQSVGAGGAKAVSGQADQQKLIVNDEQFPSI